MTGPAIRTMRLEDLPQTPWKNGGGRLRDLAVLPEGAGYDDCLWRVAVAEIERSGPFSHLPGFDRVFVPLSAGVSLAVDGAPVAALPSFAPFRFPGDAATECSLAEDAARPAQAFNLMLRRGRATGDVACFPGSGTLPPGRGATTFLVARGGFTLAVGEERVITLLAGSVARFDGPAAFEPARPWSMAVVATARMA